MDWKNSGYLGTIMVMVLVLCLNIQAQNLVPNPSFEEHTECPDGPGRISNANPWFKVRGSCDYYNVCGTDGFDIPVSDAGGGYARTGQAYAGFKIWCVNSISGVNREALGVPLIETLVEGEVYRVEFYLSMLDSIWYSSKNIGAYFSSTQPESNIDSIESYEPQVRYEGDFITDKEGWTSVSGTFVAQGGERFMSIGNFDKFEDTETLFVPDGGVYRPQQPVYWSCAEYFIDDVSVVPDSITSVQEVVDMERSYKLYPNPNTGTFTVELNFQDNEMAQLLIWNLAGQQVHSQMLGRGINALEMNAAKGLYLYGITVSGVTRWTGKIVVTSEQ